MRHAGTQTIETERLLLRPLTPEDAPMMYANWANDPDVTRWLRWEPHKTWTRPGNCWPHGRCSTPMEITTSGPS